MNRKFFTITFVVLIGLIPTYYIFFHYQTRIDQNIVKLNLPFKLTDENIIVEMGFIGQKDCGMGWEFTKFDLFSLESTKGIFRDSFEIALISTSDLNPFYFVELRMNKHTDERFRDYLKLHFSSTVAMDVTKRNGTTMESAILDDVEISRHILKNKNTSDVICYTFVNRRFINSTRFTIAKWIL